MSRANSNSGPWGAGTRVIVRNTYPGKIVGHRGPGYLVKLDKEIGGHKTVLADPAEVQLEPKRRPHGTD